MLFLSLATVYAQVPTVYIQKITVEGNKKTKSIAVLRYLNFKEGDKIELSRLLPTLKENEPLVMNSQLFTDVKIKVGNWQDSLVHIVLEVREAWYIFPIPIFELADRNFNVWWRDFDRDISRVNIGMYLIWRNPLGYNDYLKVIGKLGFTRKFEIDYMLPPIGKKQLWGYGFNLHYSQNKEQVYNTENNELLFFKDIEDKKPQYRRFRVSLCLKYRQSVFDNHSLIFRYKFLGISDSIRHLNPSFFLDSAKTQRSLVLDYEFTRNKTDLLNYPLNGYFLKLAIKKRGLGVYKDINQLWTSIQLGLYKQWHDRFSTSLWMEGRYSLIRSQQPYWQSDAIGYQDSYLRGYQYYAINGQDYFLLRSDLNFKALDLNIPLFKKASLSYARSLPLKLHTRFHFDYGYANDPFYGDQNVLDKKHLIGFGPGLDFVFYYYNLILQMEYSINNLGEKDLYLRFKYNF